MRHKTGPKDYPLGDLMTNVRINEMNLMRKNIARSHDPFHAAA